MFSNAVKYSEAKRYIGVRVARNNGHVEVAISDHGIGIPPNEQQRIFEKWKGFEYRQTAETDANRTATVQQNMMKQAENRDSEFPKGEQGENGKQRRSQR